MTRLLSFQNLSLIRIKDAKPPQRPITSPNLALMAYQVSFDGSVAYVLKGLGAANLSVANPALIKLAQRFVELAVRPLSFQAAFGIDPAQLRMRSSQCVHDAIALRQEKIAMANERQAIT